MTGQDFFEPKTKCPFCENPIAMKLDITMTLPETRTNRKYQCESCKKEFLAFIQISVIPTKYDLLCCLMCKSKDTCPEHCGKHGDVDCSEIDLQGCLDEPCFSYKE